MLEYADGTSSVAASAESEPPIPDKKISREDKKRARKTRTQRRVNPKEERRKRWLSARTVGGELNLASNGESVLCTPCLVPRKKQSDDDGTVIATRLVDDRKRARTIEHLMTHSPPCATCEGCQARARQKKHYKGAFAKSSKDRSMIITMDQLTVQDFDYSAGYAGFKNEIVY